MTKWAVLNETSASSTNSSQASSSPRRGGLSVEIQLDKLTEQYVDILRHSSDQPSAIRAFKSLLSHPLLRLPASSFSPSSCIDMVLMGYESGGGGGDGNDDDETDDGPSIVSISSTGELSPGAKLVVNIARNYARLLTQRSQLKSNQECTSGDDAEALRAFLTVVKFEHDPSAWSEIGRLLVKKNDLYSAMSAFRQGLRDTLAIEQDNVSLKYNDTCLNPEVWNCLTRLCETLFLCGDFQACIKYVEVALKVDRTYKAGLEIRDALLKDTSMASDVFSKRMDMLETLRSRNTVVHEPLLPINIHIHSGKCSDLAVALLHVYYTMMDVSSPFADEHDGFTIEWPDYYSIASKIHIQTSSTPYDSQMAFNSSPMKTDKSIKNDSPMVSESEADEGVVVTRASRRLRNQTNVEEEPLELNDERGYANDFANEINGYLPSSFQMNRLSTISYFKEIVGGGAHKDLQLMDKVSKYLRQGVKMKSKVGGKPLLHVQPKKHKNLVKAIEEKLKSYKTKVLGRAWQEFPDIMLSDTLLEKDMTIICWLNVVLDLLLEHALDNDLTFEILTVLVVGRYLSIDSVEQKLPYFLGASSNLKTSLSRCVAFLHAEFDDIPEITLQSFLDHPQSCYVRDLWQCFCICLSYIERKNIIHSKNIVDAVHCIWLRYECIAAFSFDQTTLISYLTRCFNALRSANNDKKRELELAGISEHVISSKLLTLKSKNFLDSLENDLKSETHETKCTKLEPILLRTEMAPEAEALEDMNVVWEMLDSMAITKRIRLFETLLDSLRVLKKDEKYWLCLNAYLDSLLKSSFRSKESGDKGLLQVHLLNKVFDIAFLMLEFLFTKKEMEEMEDKNISNVCILAHLAYDIIVTPKSYGNSVDAISLKQKAPNVLLLVAYLVFKSPDYSNFAAQDNEEGTLKHGDLLSLVHEIAGDHGFCRADNFSFLRKLMDLYGFEKDAEIALSGKLQCYSCLYGLKITSDFGSASVHETVVGEEPLEFDKRSAEKVFDLLKEEIQEKIQKQQLLSRDLLDVLRRIGTIHEEQRNELVRKSARLSYNRGNIMELLSRPLDAAKDFDFSCSQSEVLDVVGDMAIPRLFKEYYQICGKAILQQGLKYATNADVFRKQNRIDIFQEALDYLIWDLTWSPSRTDSWFAIAQCHMSIFEELASWSSSKIESSISQILVSQTAAVRSLKRSIELTCAEQMPKEVNTGAEFIKALEKFVAKITYYSELGHIVYGIASGPFYCLALREREDAKTLRDQLLSDKPIKRVVKKRKLFSNRSESKENICFELGEASGVSASLEDGRVEANTSSPKSSSTKTSDGDSAKNDDEEVQKVPFFENSEAIHGCVNDQVRNKAFALSGECFSMCRRLLKNLNRLIQKFNSRLEPESSTIKFSLQTSQRLSPIEPEFQCPLFAEPWEWLYMIGKCSKKLGRDSATVLSHFHQSLLLSELNDQAVIFGRLDSSVFCIDDVNQCLDAPVAIASFFAGPKSTNTEGKTLYQLDPAYAVVSTSIKAAMSDELEWTKALSFIVKVARYFDYSFAIEHPCESVQATISSIIKCMDRFIGIDKWNHRFLYRKIKMMSQLLPFLRSSDLFTVEFASSFEEGMSNLLPFRNKVTGFWRTPYEPPGRFFVNAHSYCKLYIEVAAKLENSEMLATLLRKLPRVASGQEIFWWEEKWRLAFVGLFSALKMDVEKVFSQNGFDRDPNFFPSLFKPIPRSFFIDSQSDIDEDIDRQHGLSCLPWRHPIFPDSRSGKEVMSLMKRVLEAKRIYEQSKIQLSAEDVEQAHNFFETRGITNVFFDLNEQLSDVFDSWLKNLACYLYIVCVLTGGVLERKIDALTASQPANSFKESLNMMIACILYQLRSRLPEKSSVIENLIVKAGYDKSYQDVILILGMRDKRIALIDDDYLFARASSSARSHWPRQSKQKNIGLGETADTTEKSSANTSSNAKTIIVEHSVSSL